MFAIKDTEPLIHADVTSARYSMWQMIKDALALCSRDDILLCRYSDYARMLPLFNTLLLETSTFNRLVSAHFSKDRFRHASPSSTIKEFLFPIDECSIIISSGANRIVTSADNVRFIHMAKLLARRIQATVPSLDLRGFEASINPLAPRLSGTDGTPMAKSRRNHLSLSAAANDVRVAISKANHWLKDALEGGMGTTSAEQAIASSLPAQIVSLTNRRQLTSLDLGSLVRQVEMGTLVDAVVDVVMDHLAEFRRARAAISDADVHEALGLGRDYLLPRLDNLESEVRELLL